MRKRTYTTNTWIGDGGPVRVTFNFSPGDPGCYSGPPEKCYEATDDEVEILQMTIEGPYQPTEKDLDELYFRLLDIGLDKFCEEEGVYWEERQEKLEEDGYP